LKHKKILNGITGHLDIYRSKFRGSLSNLGALLRWNLFTYRNLRELIDRPFETVPIVSKSVQKPLPVRDIGQHVLKKNTLIR
jgi:hypothetical protein